MKYIPYLTIVAIALIALTGFLVDQGGALEARQEAITIAQGAARAGTDAASGNAVNGDAFQLAGPTAIAAADSYIATAGPDTTGTAQIRDGLVTVTVHRTYQPTLTAWLGIGSLDMTGTAAARLIDQP